MIEQRTKKKAPELLLSALPDTSNWGLPVYHSKLLSAVETSSDAGCKNLHPASLSAQPLLLLLSSSSSSAVVLKGNLSAV